MKAHGIILDISLVGAQIEGRLPLTEGSLVKVTFLVASGEDFSVGVHAVRCRDHTYQESKTFRFALKFSQLEPDEHRKLGELVYQSTKRTLGSKCKT